MKLRDLIKFYGDFSDIHKNLGVTRQCVSFWKFRGYIPLAAQYKIENLTEGKLKASVKDGRPPGFYKRKVKTKDTK